MLVAGVLAITIFKEVKGKAHIIAFMCCGVLLIVGAAILAQFGKCN